MTHVPTRRLAIALAAIVALALSAGAALAARPMPTAADGGLKTAAEAAGQTVPVRTDAEDGQEAPEATATPDATETPVAPATPDATSHPDNHGALVSAAAQGTTPDGFDNHGAYVSSIARQNAGQTKSAAARAAHQPTDPGKPTGAGQPSH